MIVVINQFFALGDILFIEPIYRHYHNRGFKVVAPVNPEHLWIAEYIPYVEFVDVNTYPFDKESPTQKEDGKIHIALRFAHPLLRGHALHFGDERHLWMPDKYEYLGLPVDLWRTLSFKRNEERENALFNLLELEGKEYDFVNENFGGSFEKVNISKRHTTVIPRDEIDESVFIKFEGEEVAAIGGVKTSTSLYPSVHLRKIEGFTMLDWGKVIENAENIYTVETSVIYYIESLKTKAKEKHLYPRLPWLGNCEYMRLALGDSWEYHDENNM
jgi:hypothetical protein